MANEQGRIPSIRFRTYGEVYCLAPLLVIGMILWGLYSVGLISEAAATPWWLFTLYTCMIMVAVDVRLLYTVIAIVAVGAILFLLPYWGITFMVTFFKWLMGDHGVVAMGAIVLTNAVLAIVIGLTLTIGQMAVHEFTPNQIQTKIATNRDWMESTAGIACELDYKNGLKQLLFGMGDIVFKRNGMRVHRIEDVPYLWWVRGRRIERFLEQRLVTSVPVPSDTDD